MISDVLAEAVESIKSYLNDPTYEKMYEGKMRERINKLVKEMKDINLILDTPPKEDDKL